MFSKVCRTNANILKNTIMTVSLSIIYHRLNATWDADVLDMKLATNLNWIMSQPAVFKCFFFSLLRLSLDL